MIAPEGASGFDAIRPGALFRRRFGLSPSALRITPPGALR